MDIVPVENRDVAVPLGKARVEVASDRDHVELFLKHLDTHFPK